MVSRRCSSCGRVLPKQDYSSTQWSKKKDGKQISKCKDCVAFNHQEGSGGGGGLSYNILNSGLADHLLPEDNSAVHLTDKDLGEMISRLENPEGPPHPDMGKTWLPSQTMEVTSGCICFGLSHQVQSGADEDAVTFEDAAYYYGDDYCKRAPLNTVAKNGKWLAYKLIDRNATLHEYFAQYDGCSADDRIAGCFICHEDVSDPVEEMCRMVYNTFDGENGGNYRWGMSNNTHPFHVELGYILIARYAIGYPPGECVEEDGGDENFEEGVVLIDHSEAKKAKSEWSNCIRGIDTCGASDICRLKYSSDGLCEAFLLTGDSAQFQTIHFSVDGGAPLGRDVEDWEEDGNKASKPTCDIPMRCCTNCGQNLTKGEYSNKQWSKKKGGEYVSKCMKCVAEQDDQQEQQPRSNYFNEQETTLEYYENELENIIRHIDLSERYLVNPNDESDDEMLKNLAKQKHHWNLCYQREELREKIRLKTLDAEWRKHDMLKAVNLDGDNVTCALCDSCMPLDGESGFYRANRLFCCGIRYCLRRCHMKDMPDICPGCNSVPIISREASKENLLCHAEGGKTWAQLELAERYVTFHSSVKGEEADKLHDDDRRSYYEDKAIEWARKASDSGNIHAIIFLANNCYKGSIYDVPERFILKKRAADTGDPKNIEEYAEHANMFVSREEALKYASLCVYHSVDEKALGRAYGTLGDDCENTCGAQERQLYLFEQGAMHENHSAMVGFAYCLNNSSIARYGSTDFAKYSQLPKIYYWAKKAAETQLKEALELLENVELHHIDSDKCACLGIGLCCSDENRSTVRQKKCTSMSRKQTLFPCERCETVYYCSEQCRVRYDAVVGHKKDCCDCADCKTNGPYMGFADWKRQCNGPSTGSPYDDLHNEMYS